MTNPKVRYFVDFWNFQLTLNEVAPKGYKLDWKEFPSWLSYRASEITGQHLQFDGIHIYMSYNRRSAKDRRLRDWAMNVLDRLPGTQVILRERKAKGPPTCPSCHKLVSLCPYCGATMSGTVEKGSDVALVTDLLTLAWDGAWQVAVLVSSDRDFIPAVERLGTRGFRIINAHFPPKGMHLARTCWASIDLRKGLTDLERS